MVEFEQRLLSDLQDLKRLALGDSQRLWVGYSGGVDSHVLLFALSRLRAQLSDFDFLAVHVDHQLSSLSPQWSEHCRHICGQLQIPYKCIVVNAKAEMGESPEAKARAVRYDAFSSLMKHNDCLLTAHHQDDQAETLLLQLLRGSGPRGLAAMPRYCEFGSGFLARPLLGFTREEILRYARQRQLQWIDDISNEDPAFDRNFLRLQVVPLLKQRWPSLAKTLSRSAQLCADTLSILDTVADEDLRRVEDGTAVGRRLCITPLQALPMERQFNLLRAWLKRLGLPCPSQKTLQHMEQQVIQAATDSTPRLQWPGGEVRRYRDYLYAMHPMEDFDRNRCIPWNVNQALAIEGVGKISVVEAKGCGLKKQLLQDAVVSIRFRQGGERCKLPDRGVSHGQDLKNQDLKNHALKNPNLQNLSLKNLFQECGIVPWMRERVPLIYIDDQLAAVGDLWTCAPYHALENERGVQVVCDYQYSVR